MFDDVDFPDNDEEEAHERRITRCNRCRERIIFLDGGNGKRVPVDADTVDICEGMFDEGCHERHSCALSADELDG